MKQNNPLQTGIDTHSSNLTIDNERLFIDFTSDNQNKNSVSIIFEYPKEWQDYKLNNCRKN